MTDDSTAQAGPQTPDIQQLLTRMAPADTPADAIEYCPAIAALIEPLDPLKTLDILAGMMTEPRFQANTIRLDYAVRLVLVLGIGKRRVGQPALLDLLNSKLEQAHVPWLEDPIEDFFVESIPTRLGDFLLFSGYWEKAGSYTELLLQAFEGLPNAQQKRTALRQAYALLKVSSAVVQRAELQRRIVGSGDPKGYIAVPSETRLSALARRVRFTSNDLSAIGIEMTDLGPFFLQESDKPNIRALTPGDSALEFRPLLRSPHGFTVVAPANISTAVRAHLIEVAVSHGKAEQLQGNLLQAGAWLTRQSGFGLKPDGVLQRCEDQLYRETFQEISPGRFVQIIQSVDGFTDWPRRAFGTVVPCTPQWVRTLQTIMQDRRKSLQAREGFVEGMTMWFASGWGAGRSVSYTEEFNDWPLVMLDPADALILGACEDGKPADIWRLEKQIRLVEQQGFQITNLSGLLNIFRWWQKTDHALLPPHETDIRPPTHVDFGTDLLLETRQEGAEALDRRTGLHPGGARHLLERLERGAMAKAFGPVYGSLGEAMQGRLCGVVLHEDVAWWFEDETDPAQNNRNVYENWRTALLWAARVMPKFLERIRRRDKRQSLVFKTRISDVASIDGAVGTLSDEEIDAAVKVTVELAGTTARIELGQAWSRGAYRADNYAEITLAAAILEGAARIHELTMSAADLRDLAMNAAGSTDFRHRHAFQAERAIERLAALGLTKGFKPIPLSASALAKCGSVWPSHPRANGVVIEGKDECIALLERFKAERLSGFTREIKRYDRKSLVVLALEGLQATIADERHWGRSARALGAIHGLEDDFRLSMDRNVKSNGVMRANSMIAEFAACEAPLSGGLTAGRMDIEELQALALQLFHAGDMLPPLHAERIQPSIHLSPTGDLLYHHDFEEATIKVGAELRHASAREADRANYVERFSRQSSATEPDLALSEAIEEEYRISAALWREVPNSLVSICEKRKTGILTLRRSDLVLELGAIDYLADHDAGPLIDRLTLPVRKGWDDMSAGSRPADFDFFKFDRRFSLIARPIVALTNDTDPELAVAPGLVERAFMHNVGGALVGALQNEFWQSEKMRRYASTSGSKAGVEFNESVAQAVRALGLRAWPSAKPSWCLNLKNTDEVKRLGDIDVLAISIDGKRIWVVEAKDLKLCRTLGEAARRLSDYRGQTGKDGKPDKLLRHLGRVTFLRARAADLVRPFGLSVVPEVHGVLIVNAPQPMQQLHRDYSADSTVVMLDHIETVPWSKGW